MRRGGGTLSVSLAALLFCSAVLAAGQAKEEEALTSLRSAISKLRKDLDRTRDRFDQTWRELRDMEERIGALAKGLKEFDAKIKQQQRRLGEFRLQQAALEASVAHQRDYLAQQVRAAYAMGQQEYLRLLLNQENPATIGRLLAYYDYFNRARAQRIGDLQETLTSLEKTRAAVEEQGARLQVIRNERSREKEKYVAERHLRSALLASLKGDIASKDRRLGELAADERDLESVIVALRHAAQEKARGSRPFERQRGKLPWPTSGPLQVRFGAERAQGKLRWQGVLIRARLGQEVRAIAHGRVVFADWLRGYGLLVVIDHGDGYMSLYAHNQSLFKETGDWVESGHVIAAVGDSGGQEAEALYFEIRHNGEPVDPVKWCHRSHG